MWRLPRPYSDEASKITAGNLSKFSGSIHGAFIGRDGPAGRICVAAEGSLLRIRQQLACNYCPSLYCGFRGSPARSSVTETRRKRPTNYRRPQHNARFLTDPPTRIWEPENPRNSPHSRWCSNPSGASARALSSIPTTTWLTTIRALLERSPVAPSGRAASGIASPSRGRLFLRHRCVASDTIRAATAAGRA